MSEVRGSGWEELPCIVGQGRGLGGDTLQSEVSGGGWEELPHVRGQWRPGGAPCVPDQGQPEEATSLWRPGSVTLRSHPKPEARGGSWEEPPTPKARAGGRRPGGATPGAVAEQAQEGLEELSHIERQERWQ